MATTEDSGVRIKRRLLWESAIWFFSPSDRHFHVRIRRNLELWA